MALVGPAGAGKSHLASIWAAQSGARFLSARALHSACLPASLATGALVVEDMADSVADELALFHLLNLAREENAHLLFTARKPPTPVDCRVAGSGVAPARAAGGRHGCAG